jgi:hypothetical protein
MTVITDEKPKAIASSFDSSPCQVLVGTVSPGLMLTWQSAGFGDYRGDCIHDWR